MTYSAVIFDLDGTLLDTLADIAHTANSVLAELGFGQHPADAYRQFVGEGVRILFRKALPEEARSREMIDRCAEAFRSHYERHWKVHTRPYEGIRETLAKLKSLGLKMAVLSNKPDPFTKKCVDEYLGEFDFDLVLGQRDHVPRKPDPTAALQILDQLGVSGDACVYVGDTAIDMETAVRAGLYPVGVSWGFRPRPELEKAGAVRIIDSPQQLLEIINGYSQ